MSTVPSRAKRVLTVVLVVALLVLGVVIFATARAEAEARCTERPSVCLIRKYWRGDDAAALRVARCESGYDERAQRPGSQFIGVFQIGSDIHAERIARLGYDTDDLRDAGKNTAVAYSLWQDAGWGPWECA